jgi:hypothetical protein
VQVTVHANDLEVGQNGLTTGNIVRCASCFQGAPADPPPPCPPWLAMAQAFCAAWSAVLPLQNPYCLEQWWQPAVMPTLQESGVRHRQGRHF